MTDAAPATGELRRARPRSAARRSERIAAGLLVGACLATLVTAGALTPDASGHGTHTQLGMSPCAWAVAFDAPCATCGWTTAFALAADGDLRAAFLAQPFGCLGALAAAGVFWGAVHVAATGSRTGHAALRALAPGPLLVVAGLLVAAWAYKWATWTSIAGDGLSPAT